MNLTTKYETKHKQVLGLLNHILKDKSAVDDVAQDVWLKVICNHHKLRDPEKFDAWLMITCRNTACRHIFNQSSRVVQMVGFPDGFNPPVPSEAVQNVEASERVRILSEALASLDSITETILTLKYMQDLKHREIAQRLNIPINTVGVKSARGLTLLRKWCVQHGYNFGVTI